MDEQEILEIVSSVQETGSSLIAFIFTDDVHLLFLYNYTAFYEQRILVGIKNNVLSYGICDSESTSTCMSISCLIEVSSILTLPDGILST